MELNPFNQFLWDWYEEGKGSFSRHDMWRAWMDGHRYAKNRRLETENTSIIDWKPIEELPEDYDGEIIILVWNSSLKKYRIASCRGTIMRRWKDDEDTEWVKWASMPEIPRPSTALELEEDIQSWD